MANFPDITVKISDEELRAFAQAPAISSPSNPVAPLVENDENDSQKQTTVQYSGQKVEKPLSLPTPNRATRRARAQNMKRQTKHLSRMFVLTCPNCHKPFIAPVAQKCACPVARPLDQSRSK